MVVRRHPVLVLRHAAQFLGIYPMGIVELPVCLVAVTTSTFNTGLIQTPPKTQSWAARHVPIAPRRPVRMCASMA
jgi:hypothetical protein